MKNKNRVKAWANRSKTFAVNFKNNIMVEPCEIVFNNGWIHVSERRPNRKSDGDTVMVWNPNADMVVVVDPQIVYVTDDVFWQPFPKPPKKIGKKGRR